MMSGSSQQYVAIKVKSEETLMKKAVKVVTPIKLRKVSSSEYAIVEPKATEKPRIAQPSLWELRPSKHNEVETTVESSVSETFEEEFITKHDDLFDGNHCLVHRRTYIESYLHQHIGASLSHKTMSALIEGGKERRQFHLKDFQDLFQPQSTVKSCPLCRLTFETHSLYKKHLKSLGHAEMLKLYSSTLSVSNEEEADQATAATITMASLTIKKGKPDPKPKRQVRKQYSGQVPTDVFMKFVDVNDHVYNHDDLLHQDYCLVHKKEFTNVRYHRNAKDHKEIDALLAGGTKKATLTIQNFIDLFNPYVDVTVCPLCSVDCKTHNAYMKHLKSLQHRVSLKLYSADGPSQLLKAQSEEANVLSSGPGYMHIIFDDAQPPSVKELPQHPNETIDMSLD